MTDEDDDKSDLDWMVAVTSAGLEVEHWDADAFTAKPKPRMQRDRDNPNRGEAFIRGTIRGRTCVIWKGQIGFAVTSLDRFHELCGQKKFELPTAAAIGVHGSAGIPSGDSKFWVVIRQPITIKTIKRVLAQVAEDLEGL